MFNLIFQLSEVNLHDSIIVRTVILSHISPFIKYFDLSPIGNKECLEIYRPLFDLNRKEEIRKFSVTIWTKLDTFQIINHRFVGHPYRLNDANNFSAGWCDTH